MSYDIKLTKDGDLPLGNDFVTGDDLVLQSVGVQLSQGLGEWPLDVTKGIPYEQWVEQIPAPVDAARARFSAELSSIDGVQVVEEVEVSFDADSQELTVDARLELESGAQAQLTGALSTQGFDSLSPLWQITLTNSISQA